MCSAPRGCQAHSPLPSSQNLKDVLASMIPKEQAKIKSFRQQHGNTAIGQITVDMVSGGMPGPRRGRQAGPQPVTAPSCPSPGVRRDEGHEGAGVRDLRAGS